MRQREPKLCSWSTQRSSAPPCMSPRPPRWVGAGTRCLSPPTPRAAAGQDTRVSTGHSPCTGPPAEPRRSPISKEAVQPGRTAVSPGKEQPCRGRAHLAVLIPPLQAAGQRGEDETMTGVGPTASRGLLRAAQPLTCDTGAQGLPGHPAPGTALAPRRPSEGHPRGKPLSTVSSLTPLLGHRVPFPGSSSPNPRSPGPPRAALTRDAVACGRRHARCRQGIPRKPSSYWSPTPMPRCKRRGYWLSPA